MSTNPSDRNVQPTNLSGDAAVERVRGLLGKFHSAMMITTVASGQLHMRPMAPVSKAADFDGTLWFFTDDRSRKIAETQQQHAVSLVFQSDSTFLHLRGRASVAHDRAKMKELYTPLIKTWFPDGLEDPHLTLLRVDADSGEFWDNPGGVLQVLAAFTKAVVTGTPGAGGEAGTLRL